MPEDVKDMLTDFSMMLDGITLDKSNGLNERVKCRLACYWADLHDRILKELEKEEE